MLAVYYAIEYILVHFRTFYLEFHHAPGVPEYRERFSDFQEFVPLTPDRWC